MLPCPISSLSFHLSLLSFRCRRNLLPFSSLRLSFRRRRNLSLPFVITHILLVIPTQEESVAPCHSNYLSFVIPLILLVIPTQEESIRNCHLSYALLPYT